MTMTFLRKLAAKLPSRWQGELKRFHFRRRMRLGTFVSDEPEFALLPRLISNGDWVIDVGANVGFYTKRFAELSGPDGRVIAFEPVPDTFVLLANNMDACRANNVTLINAALSDANGIAGIVIPAFADTGQRNFYQAHLADQAGSNLKIMTLNLDALDVPVCVKLVKIDAEGHELSVLKGMQQILRRDRPLLIVETGKEEVWELLASLGYLGKQLPGSPNVIFYCDDVKGKMLEQECASG